MPDRPGVEERDGTLFATANGVHPPIGWTTEYERFGGDKTMKSLELMLYDAGADTTDLKPLFAMRTATGGDTILFQSGSPPAFYFFDPIDFSVLHITLMNDLKTIVDWIDDEDKGYASLQTKRIA